MYAGLIRSSAAAYGPVRPAQLAVVTRPLLSTRNAPQPICSVTTSWATRDGPPARYATSYGSRSRAGLLGAPRMTCRKTIGMQITAARPAM
jgi:hypothetical protein